MPPDWRLIQVRRSTEERAPPRSACGLGKGGAGCRDQGGIDDRPLLHGHADGLEVGFHRLKDLIAQIMLLQEVPERQDRCLIRDPVTDQGDAGKAAHRQHLDQRILHRWIAQIALLLHQMNPQRVSQRIRRATALGAGLGVKW